MNGHVTQVLNLIKIKVLGVRNDLNNFLAFVQIPLTLDSIRFQINVRKKGLSRVIENSTLILKDFN